MTRARSLAGALPMLLVALAGAASCGRPADAPLEDMCRVALPTRAPDAPPAAPLPAFAVPASTLVVTAEIPLARVQEGLEAKVPRRVAEERDHDLGIAGRLEYTVDRGAFAVSVRGDALVVEAPLDAHARACARGACYAGCDPSARVTARVPLRLGADYKFRPSSVRVDVTRGCELRALGGMVRVDLTPILEQRLTQEAPRVAQSIDHELPDLRPEAERIWRALEEPRPIALGACAVLAPEALTQGAPSGAGDLARLRFGLVARPEVRVRCGASPARSAPLPPLKDDDALPAEGDVHLAVVLPPDAPAVALGSAPGVVDLGRGRARLGRASGTASALVVELAGEACGEVGVRATGAAWTEDGRALHLAGIAPLPSDAARLAAAELDGSALVAALERVPIGVPLAPDALAAAVPALAAALSDARVAVSAAVSDARAEGAGLRGDQPVALVRAKGAVTLRAK